MNKPKEDQDIRTDMREWLTLYSLPLASFCPACPLQFEIIFGTDLAMYQDTRFRHGAGSTKMDEGR